MTKEIPEWEWVKGVVVGRREKPDRKGKVPGKKIPEKKVGKWR